MTNTAARQAVEAVVGSESYRETAGLLAKTHEAIARISEQMEKQAPEIKGAIARIGETDAVVSDTRRRVSSVEEDSKKNKAKITASEAYLDFHNQRIANLEEEREDQREFNKAITKTVSSLGKGFEVLGTSFRLEVKDNDRYKNMLWGSIPIVLGVLWTCFKWWQRIVAVDKITDAERVASKRKTENVI